MERGFGLKFSGCMQRTSLAILTWIHLDQEAHEPILKTTKLLENATNPKILTLHNRTKSHRANYNLLEDEFHPKLWILSLIVLVVLHTAVLAATTHCVVHSAVTSEWICICICICIHIWYLYLCLQLLHSATSYEPRLRVYLYLY